MMLLAPKWVAGYSGAFVDHFGYTPFFIGTALLGLPVLLLIWLATRWLPAPSAAAAAPSADSPARPGSPA
jgi:PAT family beta-lactamase induction signal transducer AmpG